MGDIEFLDTEAETNWDQVSYLQLEKIAKELSTIKNVAIYFQILSLVGIVLGACSVLF
jgi:hypothetical protein